MPHPDVLIVGGGVIGLTTAYRLARAGVRAQVVDQGDLGREASWAGAGILPPSSPDLDLHPYDRLRAVSSAMFPTLSAELRELTGLDNGYLRCGGLEFPCEASVPCATEWRCAGSACEILDTEALHDLEAAVAPAIGSAHYLPDMAQVRNPRHVKALRAACEKLGVVLQPGFQIQELERQRERILAVRGAAGSISAGKFLIAAGAWSDGLLAQVGWRPGIRPVRGQIVLFNTGASLLQRILCRGKRDLVPRLDGRVLVGSTEEDAGFDKRTTAEAIAGLLELAVMLVPALAQAHVEHSWAGLRPGSPDGQPFLGAVPGMSNLWVAAGHFRAGIQLSPVTGLVMAELLQGQETSMPLHAFRLDRPITPGRAFRI